jgi:hypothetical protein
MPSILRALLDETALALKAIGCENARCAFGASSFVDGQI